VNPAVAFAALSIGGLILGIMECYRRRWNIANAADPVEANALRGGRLSIRDSLVVSAQTLISNGSGASVGLEAGYTRMRAGLSSLLGRWFNLRRNDLRLIVGAGAAAAIASAFDAPLTGAFRPVLGSVCVACLARVTPQVLAADHGAMVLDLSRELTIRFIVVAIASTTMAKQCRSAGWRYATKASQGGRSLPLNACRQI
jgi:chloride channel protein, CIC family